MSLKRHAPEKGNFRPHRQECRVTSHCATIWFCTQEFFVRSLVTVQGRYRTRMQRHSVRMHVAFWPEADVPNDQKNV